MPELRQRANCIGLGASFSVVRDMFGFLRGVVPPDPVTGRVSVSLRTQLDQLGGRHIHLNVIATGADNFTDADNIEVDYAIFKLRNVYRQVGLGVGRVQHWAISVADANGLDAPTEEGQLQELTERWEVPNNGIDLFVVHDMNIPSNGGMLLGRSAVDGPCEDKDRKGMEAATAGLWGSERTARTIAHELGHYLTLDHRNDEPDNLMCQTGKASSIRNSTVLTNDQGSDMRDHCMTHGGCDVIELQPGRYSVEELRTMIFEKRGPLAPVLALATLRRTDYPEAEKLADLRRAAENTGLDIRTRRAAVLELGRIGAAGATRILEELGSLAATPSLARARAESLRLLGAGVTATDTRPPSLIAGIKAAPTRFTLPPFAYSPLPMRRAVPIIVAGASPALLEPSRRALASVGLEASPTLLHLDCLGHEHLLTISTEVAADPQSALLDRAASLGVLLARHAVEHENWSPRLFLFSEPVRTGPAGTVAIRAVGHDGVVILAGEGTVTRDEVLFTLQAMDVPGNVAVEIDGVLRRGRVEIVRAASDARPIPARVPRPR
jgi:hypothetical protein